MRNPILGIFVGLVLGVALTFRSFGAFVVVALFGAIGYLVGKVVDGDIDLTTYLGGGRDRQNR
ncbi:MAG: hypothetical protein NVSMB13_15860 [Mycobacteriales bacterium]